MDELDDAPVKLSKEQIAAMALHKQPTLFNGVYTVERNGQHRTFKVTRQPDDAEFAPGQQLIELLIGQDNTTNYKSFGFVSNRGIYVFRKLSEKNKEWKAYADLVWTMATQPESNKYINLGYKLSIARCCYRCNRLLTTPESIRLGIGPVCAVKMYEIPF